MPIIKSLKNRIVSREEALAYHFRTASEEEARELVQQRTWRAMTFARKFQTTGMLATIRHKTNPYDRAAAGIAKEVQAAGRAACQEGCGMCVYRKNASQYVTESLVMLKAECQVDGCPEDGLVETETIYARMPEEAQQQLAQPITIEA